MKPEQSELMRRAAKFVVNECVVGDYYEFGVYQGAFFYGAMAQILNYSKHRLENSARLGKNETSDAKRLKIMNETIFHAFDSFEGLPELTQEDKYSEDFLKGQFACGEEAFLENGKRLGAPMSRIRTHKGWYEKTCTAGYAKGKINKRASIIMLDCDLYSSARDAFALIGALIQDGTILIIDDWFSNKGSPFHGVQKAFYEWSKSPKISEGYHFTEYQRETWKRISFIANKKPKN